MVVLRSLAMFAFLAALWLLLSGIYKPLIIGFGAVSVVLVVWIARRMDITWTRSEQGRLLVPGSLAYIGWLIVEILKADIAVVRTILSRDMKLSQQLIRVPAEQVTDVGQVVFANSITLTPGTITVETEDHWFLVHALTDEAADLTALAEMGARVSALESTGRE